MLRALAAGGERRLRELLGTEVADPGPQVDKAEELRQKWQVERGQVWEVPSRTVVGRCHRVMCGDSTVKMDVEQLMDGGKANACVTDLPYNIGKDYGTWDDGLPESEFWKEMVPRWLAGICAVLEQPSHFVTTFSERGLLRLVESAQTAGFNHRHTGVWHNPIRKAGSYPGQWPFAWEPVLDFSFGGWRKLNNRNGVGYSDVWILDSPVGHKDNEKYHPTEKPLILYVDLVNLVTKIGEIVYEPCAGTGTTLVACEQTERIGYGMEIEPKSVAVTLERLAGMGLEPRLVE